MTSQNEKAELLLKLHQEGESLLLPNAWDCASARLFETAGFPAIATTSSGIAFSNGYRDGQQISRDEMLHVVGRIVAAVQAPVTADVEAGYGPKPEDVATTIRGVIAAGAVGVNLEDNTGRFQPLYPIEEQVERITAAHEEAQREGVHLVVNARIDTYLRQVGTEETRLEETLKRARAYLEAGADSIFVPGVLDLSLIEVLVREIPAPLNILARPGGPSAPELFKLGVRRISIGGSAMFATMGLVRDIARELREHGTYENIAQHSYTFADAWNLFGGNEA
jgi:2-methylisocitrate lyase-like PEP mutase family enzyme